MRPRQGLAALTLILAAPVLAELVSGATTFSHLDSLVVVIPLYGAGVLLIRELTWDLECRWLARVVWGLAYGLLEEGVVFRSLFDPTLFDAASFGGRAGGVNLVWATWVLGYHALWSVVIPIALCELVFAPISHRPWLRWPGRVVAALAYVGAAFALGHFVRTNMAPAFHVGHGVMAACVTIALALAGVGYGLGRRLGRPMRPVRRMPGPIACGACALAAAGSWFGLLRLPPPLKATAAAVGVCVVAIGAAALAARCLSRFARSPGWTEQHALFAIGGTMAASAMWGLASTSGAGDRLFLVAVDLPVCTALAWCSFTMKAHRNRRQCP